MWWRSVEQAGERNLQETLARIQENLLPKNPFVYGVGSTTNSGGVKVPLLLIDDIFDPIRRFDGLDRRPFLKEILHRLPNFNKPPFAGWERRWSPKWWLNPYWHTEGDLFLMPLWLIRQLSSLAGNTPAFWLDDTIPQETIVMFSPPPIPIGAASQSPVPSGFSKDNYILRKGIQIWAGNRTATLGFPIRWGNISPLFTTAAHLIWPDASEIVFRKRRFLRPTIETAIGSVFYYSPPDSLQTKDGGVDVALINPGFPQESNFQAVHPVDPATVKDESIVILNGAKSGQQRGKIIGSMNVVRTAYGMTWKNCWNIVEIDRGFAQPGDSGGPVTLLESARALGSLVCVLAKVHSNGRFQCGIVQDIDTVLAFFGDRTGDRPILLEQVS